MFSEMLLRRPWLVIWVTVTFPWSQTNQTILAQTFTSSMHLSLFFPWYFVWTVFFFLCPRKPRDSCQKISVYQLYYWADSQNILDVTGMFLKANTMLFWFPFITHELSGNKHLHLKLITLADRYRDTCVSHKVSESGNFLFAFLYYLLQNFTCLSYCKNVLVIKTNTLCGVVFQPWQANWAFVKIRVWTAGWNSVHSVLTCALSSQETREYEVSIWGLQFVPFRTDTLAAAGLFQGSSLSHLLVTPSVAPPCPLYTEYKLPFIYPAEDTTRALERLSHWIIFLAPQQ